eukprot:2797006-Rhodomonas_salina.2
MVIMPCDDDETGHDPDPVLTVTMPHSSEHCTGSPRGTAVANLNCHSSPLSLVIFLSSPDPDHTPHRPLGSNSTPSGISAGSARQHLLRGWHASTASTEREAERTPRPRHAP